MPHDRPRGYKPVRSPLDPLLSVNELAELLGVARSTVYRIVRRGGLPYLRAGERIRFRRSDVDAYLERETA